MSHCRSWRSVLKAYLGFEQHASVSGTEPAEPISDASGGATHMCPDVNRDGPDLLLMRMEALQLQPSEVKTLMPSEFRVLARVCDHCQDKARCERDLIYEAAGKVVGWERYCPNAPRLRPMACAVGRGLRAG
jgi:hypothetical protein